MSVGFGLWMFFGVCLSLLFVVCMVVVLLIVGLIFSRVIDEYFVEFDYMVMFVKFVVFCDELCGFGLE